VLSSSLLIKVVAPAFTSVVGALTCRIISVVMEYKTRPNGIIKFMNYLANGIKKYYIKSKRKIIFKNNLTLNELALRMWEISNFHGIDSSIVSKVLSGKRLFTPSQLKIFCELLRIKKTEKEYLFYCLNQDYNIKHGVTLQTLFAPSPSTLHFLESIKEEAEKLSSSGKCYQLYSLTSLLEDYLENLLNKSTDARSSNKLNILYRQALYLKGRAIGGISTPASIIKEINLLARKLDWLNRNQKEASILADSYALQANACYVKGAYSDFAKKIYFKSAIYNATEAIKMSSVNDLQYLFPLRTLIASAIELDDKETFVRVFSHAKRILLTQPQNNFPNSLHLAGTLAKGIAKYHLGDPFRLKEEVKRYFRQDLNNCELYEISELKMFLETLQLLRSKSDKQGQQLVKKALLIGDKVSYLRHKQAILAINEAQSR
jgi:hypothetical protein